MIETDYGCEINLTRHCTNSCSSCNHGSTKFTPKWFMDPVVLKEDLDTMKQYLRTKLLFCQGGEPLLHPKLVELMGICYDSGIARHYGVLSNGKLLKRMGDDFWEMLATRKMELRLSVYPDLPEDIVPFALEKAQKWGFHCHPQVLDAFKPVFRSEPTGQSFFGCPWRYCLTIHCGYFYRCPLTAFWPEYMRRSEKWKDLPDTVDAIPIPGMTDEKLDEFLKRNVPFESCKICSGATGPSIPITQVPNKDQWEKEAGIAEALA